MPKQMAYDHIRTYIRRGFAYDFVKAAHVAKKRGIKPDPETCWERRIGICQDIAAVAVRMLRAVGIKATLVAGHADHIYHAWVESEYGTYDPTGDIVGKRAAKYTKERVIKI